MKKLMALWARITAALSASYHQKPLRFVLCCCTVCYLLLACGILAAKGIGYLGAGITRTEAVFTDAGFEQAYRASLADPQMPLYAEELAQLSTITLVGPGEADLKDLTLFKNLTALTVNECSLTALQTLGELPLLSELTLQRCELTDTDFITILENTALTKLNLSYNRITALPEMLAREEIETLHLAGNDIKELLLREPFETVKKLNLNHNPLTALNASAVSAVEELHVGWTALEDWQFLQGNTSIHTLEVSGLFLDEGLMGAQKLEKLLLFDRSTLWQREIDLLKRLPAFSSIQLDGVFTHEQLSFMVGNFNSADAVTKAYLVGQKNRLTPTIKAEKEVWE